MCQHEATTRDNQSRSDLPQSAAVMLDRLRTRRPAVHCITNSVTQNFTANFLLAAGCVPSMTRSSDEIAAFVRSLSCTVMATFPSAIAGGDGNREFFIAAQRD